MGWGLEVIVVLMFNVLCQHKDKGQLGCVYNINTKTNKRVDLLVQPWAVHRAFCLVHCVVSLAEQSTLVLSDDNELRAEYEWDEGNHGTHSNSFISMLLFSCICIMFHKDIKMGCFQTMSFLNGTNPFKHKLALLLLQHNNNNNPIGTS